MAALVARPLSPDTWQDFARERQLGKHHWLMTKKVRKSTARQYFIAIIVRRSAAMSLKPC